MNNALLIIHYNDYESLKNLIDNVKDYKCLNKIIIVDNNSRDDEIIKVRKLISDRIELIENKDNKGFSYAINVGSKRCEELGIDNIFVSNCDVIIKAEKDLEKLLSYINNPDIGVIGPVIEEFGTLNRGWKNPTPILDSLMNIVGIHRYIRNKYIFYKDDYYKDDTTNVEVLSGCFFLIKTNVLKEIGYLDENVFLYYEENILAKKIKNINRKLSVVNGVHIIHNHSVSIDKNVKKIRKLKIQKKSQYYYHRKYNNANIIEKFLLKATAFVNRNILRIVYLFKK